MAHGVVLQRWLGLPVDRRSPRELRGHKFSEMAKKMSSACTNSRLFFLFLYLYLYSVCCSFYCIISLSLFSSILFFYYYSVSAFCGE